MLKKPFNYNPQVIMLVLLFCGLIYREIEWFLK